MLYEVITLDVGAHQADVYLLVFNPDLAAARDAHQQAVLAWHYRGLGGGSVDVNAALAYEGGGGDEEQHQEKHDINQRHHIDVYGFVFGFGVTFSHVSDS